MATSQVKPFSGEQKYYLDTGKKNAERLGHVVQTALGISKKKYEVKRHSYIYSPPGAGKTFTVQTEATKAKIEMVKIQGASSLNALTIRIATAVYSIPKGNIIVWVDDCDTLFMDEKGLNIMKGILDEERNVLSWNVNLTNQILTYEKSTNENDLLKAAALRAFQTEGGVGVEIPTDRVRFIITSNKNLCPPADIHTRKGSKKINMHEAAIRDRVNYEEFELSSKESWGWIAAVLMANKVLDLNQGQKQLLLDWMWDHWDKLPANSMRAVKDRAAEMLNHPNDYPDYWNSILRK
jgi:AAA+ superfamily predicted ATPase